MNERIDLILDLTRRLSQLVEREIALIQAQEPHRLADRRRIDAVAPMFIRAEVIT